MRTLLLILVFVTCYGCTMDDPLYCDANKSCSAGLRCDQIRHECVPESPPGADEALALRALEKVERTCLISSSLKGPVHLHPQLVVAPAAVG